ICRCTVEVPAHLHPGGASMSIVRPWSLLLLSLTVARAACHTSHPATAPSRRTPTASAVAAPPAAPRPPPPTSTRPPPIPASEAELFQRKSLSELNGEHPLSDAFFDYDQDILRDEARQALQQDARLAREVAADLSPGRRPLR